jgi:hypothetical protein
LTHFAFSQSFFDSVTTGSLGDLFKQRMLPAGDYFALSCVDLKDFEKASSYGQIKKIRFVPCAAQVDLARSFAILGLRISFLNTTKGDAELNAAVSTTLLAMRSHLTLELGAVHHQDSQNYNTRHGRRYCQPCWPSGGADETLVTLPAFRARLLGLLSPTKLL